MGGGRREEEEEEEEQEMGVEAVEMVEEEVEGAVEYEATMAGSEVRGGWQLEALTCL